MLRSTDLFLLAGLGIALAGNGEAGDPVGDLARLRAARLDATRAVRLDGETIDLGVARLIVDSAIVVPAEAIGSAPVEFALSGSMRFVIEPPDEVEAAQLELFTGKRALDLAVDDAVLAAAEGAIPQRLLTGPAVRLDPGSIERAERAYRGWREGPERRRAGVEASLVRALAGDAALRGYVAIACHAPEIGAFFFENDPEDPESLTLASFVPVDIRGWDRRRLARHIRFQQRKGRFLELRLEDLGAWDIWLSGGRDLAKRSGLGFESRHYDLDVTVRRKRRLLDGRARIEIETIEEGRTTVPFEIHPDLRVREAYASTGDLLPFVQIGSQIIVALGRAPSVGQRFTIELRYTGRALQWVGSGVHDLVDTDDWYPHAGAVDRATYDLTLRWPRKQELLAGGRLIDSGETGKYRFERRAIDRPAIAASFVLGDLRVESRKLGRIGLRIGFDRTATATDRERTISTIDSALEFLERMWGELPVQDLTVVMLPRDYAQSYLGFVTLNDSMLDNAQAEMFGASDWVRETTIAHELAHQWWGNLVGWSSYRDQWLSESMANYAALLYWAERTGRPDSLLGELATGWRESLERLSPDGRTVESIGPVVLGHRLNSSKASGYQTVVYRKGAVVLAMLARAVGPERFHDTLRALLSEEGRVLTTDDFLDELADAGGIDLAGFARTFVYGTGIPEYYYRYDFDRIGDGWLVRGETSRRPRGRVVVRIDPEPAGGFTVVRDVVGLPPPEPATLRVPFRIVGRPLTAPSDPAPAKATAVEGELTLRGDGRFEVETDIQPAMFRLDPQGEVLARFVPESDTRRTLELRAEDRLATGDLAGAEDLLRRGLQAAPTPTDDGLPAVYRDLRMRREEGRLRVALARLYFADGRTEDARAEVEALEAVLDHDRGTLWFDREVLAARLDLASGAYDDAQRRLRKLLGRDLTETPRVRADLAAEAWAILAIAAHAAGDERDARAALAAARARGADVSALAAVVDTAKR